MKATAPAIGVLLGYAWVSKGDAQNNTHQVERCGRPAAASYSRKPLPTDAGTGGNCIACSTSCAEGNIVLVWKLDRPSRSLKDVPHHR